MNYRNNHHEKPFQRNGSYTGKGERDYSNQREPIETPEDFFKKAGFKPEWITEGADMNLPAFAEEMGRYMAKNKLSNSQIRSVYGEIKRIQMGKFDNLRSSFYLLKPKVAYALGRERENTGLKMFKILVDTCFDKVTDSKTYDNFCNLVEAVLAYHKANGGE